MVIDVARTPSEVQKWVDTFLEVSEQSLKAWASNIQE